MMGFTKGAVQEGTMEEPSAAVPAGIPRPKGIPEHYIFDTDVELWMPPSAVQKAAAAAAAAMAAAPAAGGTLATVDSGIQIIKSSTCNPSPYESKSDDPICFEFTNSGVCGRLARGEICRYRHLDASHPDVIADKVRQGKLPAIALDAVKAGNAAAIAVMTNTSSPATGADVPLDPGPGASLCFDYINNGSCSRLSSGQTCKYRHLPPTHPDVIADKIRNGKLNPASAVQLLSATEGTAQVPASVTDLLKGIGGANAAAQAVAPNLMGAAAGALGSSTAGVAAAAAVHPDPGPGFQLCFDFINKGTCQRLLRGEVCKYRHLPPNHPEVVADKIRQGKPPGALPTPPMGNYIENLAMLGSVMHGTLKEQAADQAAAPKSSAKEDEDDLGERFRSRDKSRKERYEREDRRDYDRRDYDRRDYDRRDYDRRDYDRRGYDRRGYDRRDYDRRDYDRRDYDRRDYDRRDYDRRDYDRRDYDRRDCDRRDYDRRDYDRRDEGRSDERGRDDGRQYGEDRRYSEERRRSPQGFERGGEGSPSPARREGGGEPQ